VARLREGDAVLHRLPLADLADQDHVGRLAQRVLERRAQLLMDLSLNLKAIISQRLIPKKGSKGRVAAIEIMLNSPLMADLIFKGEVHEMKALIARSRELGMQTFDQALFDLFEEDMITYEDALRNADSVNDLRLKIKLESKNAKNRDLGSGLEHLEIVK
jgi:twitching motility protein PilU